MKVLYIENQGEYYLFPEGVGSAEEFASLLENTQQKFIKLRRLFDKTCVRPYFVFEEIKDVFVAVNHIEEFYEDEVVILQDEEYEKMLENIKNRLCARCDSKHECLADKKIYREKLCLDGSCFEFCEDEE